jgi:hypothetical protein
MDGPSYPVKKMITEVVQAVQPKIFITTGPAEQSGKKLRLGTLSSPGKPGSAASQFKGEMWAAASYQKAAIPAGAIQAITPLLTKPNASRISGARSVPKPGDRTQDAIVTTDFYGFEDSTEPLQTCGAGPGMRFMGDAMVGIARLEGEAETTATANQNGECSVLLRVITL